MIGKKGYAGGLVVSATYCLHIGLLGFRPDDAGVSFTVLVGLSSDSLAQTETDHGGFRPFVTDVRRFDVKDSAKALST